ncbi:Pre-mRNA-splicing factor SYF1 [Puccinia graminis f. sp. tritici]|uniref:Pre-mRNA-splicing factor SYF1 n=1 Tax=Puccinia graminis f. sp. tritici TaxID=56615 RepID=A0A5B0RTI6_PUCGR|nr:Pre-mRNA-splicing factor SYF1 [Puccinia graminis f. sp. tritici]
MALGRYAVQVGLEQATEERENGSSQRGPPPIIDTNDVLACRPNMAGIHEGERTGKPEPNNGQGEPAGTALVEVIKKRSQLLAQAGKRIPNPNLPIQPITSSRLVPRSTLATDTDNQSVDGSQVNLIDVLSQPAANSAALGISASTPAHQPRTLMGEVPSVIKKLTANTQSVPGPPLNAPNDVHPQINITDENAELGHHPIVGSTSLPRAGLNPMADYRLAHSFFVLVLINQSNRFFSFLVEIDSPLCTDITFYPTDVEKTIATIYISSVSFEQLNTLGELFKKALAKEAAVIDMDRLKMVIERAALKTCNVMEVDAADSLSSAIISNFLCGGSSDLISGLSTKLKR